MDIRQLRYFLILAEEGQVSRAAKKLNMSQPPLSQQLRLMEEELGRIRDYIT
jgi:LysR family transcriptional regulator, salicylic acid-responsive activator of bsdBCD